MRKIYYMIIGIIFLVIIIFLYLLSGLELILLDLILINFIFYLIRPLMKATVNYFFTRRIYQTVISSLYSIIWMIFIFMLVFYISLDFFIAIVSFLIVAISFTLKNIINNMTSGGLMLAQEQFEIGDLIESNGIQGIVTEINLNYTKLREFDGVTIIIPNSKVYSSPIIKFTRRRFIIKTSKYKKEEVDQYDHSYEKYVRKITRIIPAKNKRTKYVKEVEILGSIDPQKLDFLLDEVFDKYEPIFGLRPDYCIDTTRFGRLRILLYIISNNAKMVLNFLDAFLRDLVFNLYEDKIFQGWEEYKKNVLMLSLDNKKNSEVKL